MEQKQLEMKKNRSKSVDTKPSSIAIYDDDSSESEGDNIPLSLLKERPSTPSKSDRCHVLQVIMSLC